MNPTYPHSTTRPSNLLVAILALMIMATVILIGVSLTRSEPEPILSPYQTCEIITGTPDQFYDCLAREAG